MNTLLNFDREKGVRSYATSTYYASHAANKNYRVLVKAQVTTHSFFPIVTSIAHGPRARAQATKVLLSQSDAGLVATGVEFRHDGALYRARASREVILSSGSVHTPQILELSGELECACRPLTASDVRPYSAGIGNRKILEKHGIPVLLDLPAVGENLQVMLRFVPLLGMEAHG